MRLSLISLVAAGAVALGGCAYGYGDYGYGGYGYGYDGYYAGYPGPYVGYGYGFDPFGWYGDYYYPGDGIYVYDSYRRPHRWDSSQERYWSGRRSQWQAHTGKSWSGTNWSHFNRGRTR